jgi:hypothetical protein
MGTNCAPFLADLFCIHVRWNLFKSFYTRRKKSLAVAFNLTFRYIDDVLPIKNNYFHSYVDSIYPNELGIKDTTEWSTSASYLKELFKLHTNGKLTTQLYDKGDDFNFSIVNFPYLCSDIPASPADGVYILQLIRYARACSAYDHFSSRQSTDKQVDVTKVSNVSLTGSFPQILWSLQQSYLPIQPFFGPHAV